MASHSQPVAALGRNGDRAGGEARHGAHVDLPARHRHDGQRTVASPAVHGCERRKAQLAPFPNGLQPVALIVGILVRLQCRQGQHLTAADRNIHSFCARQAVKRDRSITGETQVGSNSVVVVDPACQRGEINLASHSQPVAALGRNGDRAGGEARHGAHVDLPARHRHDGQRTVASPAVHGCERRKAQLAPFPNGLHLVALIVGILVRLQCGQGQRLTAADRDVHALHASQVIKQDGTVSG